MNPSPDPLDPKVGELGSVGTSSIGTCGFSLSATTFTSIDVVDDLPRGSRTVRVTVYTPGLSNTCPANPSTFTASTMPSFSKSNSKLSGATPTEPYRKVWFPRRR